MATASRSDKGGGRTNWQNGDTIAQTPLEDDFANIYAQVNGNLDAANIAANAITNSELANNAVTNAKVDAAAAISVSKLDQTAGQLDMDIVDDFWTTTAESKTATDPGTQDSPSAATNLEQELARLRYVIKRLSVGSGALISTGAQAAAWYDGAAIGPNLLVNGSFLDNSTTPAAPFGWALVGTPNAITPTSFAGLRPEGIGRYLLVVDAAGTGGAANEGIQQTVTGLKASTLYLVEARVRPNTDVVKLVTTGAAAGTFTNLALVSTSGGGAWETLSGLIWTDATPTNIVVQLLSNATDYSFGIAQVSLREVVSPAAAATNEHEGTTSRGGTLAQTKTSVRTGTFAADAANVRADTTTAGLVVPGPGYAVEVNAEMTVRGGNPNVTISLLIEEDINGAATWPTVALGRISMNDGSDEVRIPVTWIRGADATNTVTPGSVYQYRIGSASSNAASATFQSSAATEVHRITAKLIYLGGS